MEKFIRTEDEQEKEEISDQQDKDFVSQKSVMGFIVCYLEKEI